VSRIRIASVPAIDSAPVAHAVFVLSEGPDGCGSTSYSDAVALASDGLAGDDIGALAEGATQ